MSIVLLKQVDYLDPMSKKQPLRMVCMILFYLVKMYGMRFIIRFFVGWRSLYRDIQLMAN